MPFKHDSTGVDPDMKFPLLPVDQWFPFRIYDAEEQVSKSGNNMVLAKCEVFNDERYGGEQVWHWVTFLPSDNKGAGISVHFRKCIGVPFGGNDEVDAQAWIGKRFMGKIEHSEYKGRKNHKIGEVSPMRETSSPVPDAAVSALKEMADDQIPF